MVNPDALDTLWDEYDSALIAFNHDASYSGDPQAVRESRERADRTRQALRDAGQQPEREEDTAVIQHGMAHYGKPGLRAQLRQLRTCRRPTS